MEKLLHDVKELNTLLVEENKKNKKLIHTLKKFRETRENAEIHLFKAIVEPKSNSSKQKKNG